MYLDKLSMKVINFYINRLLDNFSMNNINKFWYKEFLFYPLFFTDL